MIYEDQISSFVPGNDQEENDKRLILEFVKRFPETVLLRENEIAHLTSSGFILNPALDKVLLIHHNIRDVWAWTGGHADGEDDLLRVAIKEAQEETGASMIRPLFEEIAAIDILPVFGHWKNACYVSAHLHLSIAYLLICEESETLRVKEDENTGVEWFPISQFTREHFDASDVYLYNKLIERARGEVGGR